MLDSLYILLSLLQETLLNLSKTLLKSNNEDEEQLEVSSDRQDEDKSELEKFIEDQENVQVNPTSVAANKLENEINEWLIQPRCNSSINVLDFWKAKKYVYPELYKIAVVVLAIPCTQVSVERAFSALVLVLTKSRTRLSPENLTDILMVRLNADLIDCLNF